MRRLVLLASAVDDLRSILGHITQESGNRATARTFVRPHLCRGVARSMPQAGPRSRHVGPGAAGTAARFRSIPYRGYVIFFRYRLDQVEIVNILEGHRDVGSHLSDD